VLIGIAVTVTLLRIRPGWPSSSAAATRCGLARLRWAVTSEACRANSPESIRRCRTTTPGGWCSATERSSNARSRLENSGASSPTFAKSGRPRCGLAVDEPVATGRDTTQRGRNGRPTSVRRRRFGRRMARAAVAIRPEKDSRKGAGKSARRPERFAVFRTKHSLPEVQRLVGQQLCLVNPTGL
jgi:hypothetical protein